MDMPKKTLPPPKTEKAGSGKAIIWAIAALLVLGVCVWWLTRDSAEKEDLRARAADYVNDKLKETPLASLGDILRDTPPPPPPQILNPPTEKGTLSGRHVEGTVGSPLDMAISANGHSRTPELTLGNDGASAGQVARAPQFSNAPLPPVTEDTKVTPDYLSDFARWLTTRYQPGPRGGTLEVNIQGLNNLFGVTIAQRAKGGRASLLRYAFQPSMVQGLYKLYIDRFLADLNEASRKRGLTPEQNQQFHLALAGRAILVATALEGVVNTPDLGEHMRQIDKLGQNAVDINGQLSSAVFELDELRSSRAPKQELKATQMRVDGITARYRRAEEEHQEAQRNLADLIRKHSGQSLDDDSLLFIASWAQRRLAEGGDASAALKSCAAVLRDLAQRCANSGAKPNGR